MKQDTPKIYFKYEYFLLLLSDERHYIFETSENALDIDKFLMLTTGL